MRKYLISVNAGPDGVLYLDPEGGWGLRAGAVEIPKIRLKSTLCRLVDQGEVPFSVEVVFEKPRLGRKPTPPRKRGRPRKTARNAAMLKAYEGGKPISEIAKEYDLTWASVWRVLVQGPPRS